MQGILGIQREVVMKCSGCHVVRPLTKCYSRKESGDIGQA